VDEHAAAGVEPDATSDGGEVQDLEVDASMLDAIEGELEDIERALVLLDEGTYGRCEVCGGPIDERRLVEQPATRFCAAHLPLTLG
jgi:DnaK suppressor protein